MLGVPRLQRKNFDSPEQIRDLGRGRMAVVNLDETTVGRMKLEPGWRLSVDVAPKVGTVSCQIRHLGAALSEHLHVAVEDGSRMDVRGGYAPRNTTGPRRLDRRGGAAGGG